MINFLGSVKNYYLLLFHIILILKAKRNNHKSIKLNKFYLSNEYILTGF